MHSRGSGHAGYVTFSCISPNINIHKKFKKNNSKIIFLPPGQLVVTVFQLLPWQAALLLSPMPVSHNGHPWQSVGFGWGLRLRL